MAKKIEVSGVGCCLVDYLYKNISFSSDTFLKYISQIPGDGGLKPGQLVFTEEFEKFAGKSLDLAIRDITNCMPADKVNIGGPGIVALIHAAQMLDDSGNHIRFYGGMGEDKAGEYLRSALSDTSVNITNYQLLKGVTPSTIVLSDSNYNDGAGERIFINSIGAAGKYMPEFLDDQFYHSDIVVFGGTALVPAIHDNLTDLLIKAREEGCITVVNTVYDFRNQKAYPDKKWPLGENDDSYRNIDLLITNYEEALRLSGKRTLKEAMENFHKLGTGAVIVTNGAQDITLFANKNSIFQKTELIEMPVSAAISQELSSNRSGDTTGCGDNFAGGILASLVMQLQNDEYKIDLEEASIWGIISGGFSCYYIGGTYPQNVPGEKRKLIYPYYDAYLKQLKYERKFNDKLDSLHI